MIRISTLAISLLLSVGCLSASAFAQHPSSDTLAPFPKPAQSQRRQVIQLPELSNEQLYKVELLIGQTREVDCNQHLLLGQLQSKTVDGWGYAYYVYEAAKSPDSGPISVSTRMACPANKKERKFVAASLGEQGMLSYNSKLPIVVYTPDNIEVNYRIWKGEDKMTAAKIK